MPNGAPFWAVISEPVRLALRSSAKRSRGTRRTAAARLLVGTINSP